MLQQGGTSKTPEDSVARQRYSLNASVFAVVRQGNRVLSLRRSGTGWLDSHWSLPAGAHDGQTSLVESVLRELIEETGLTAEASNCRLLHVLQVFNPDGVEWLGLYFGLDAFTGTPVVAEPEKHDAIEWRDLTEAVDPTVPYVRAALEQIASGSNFSVYRA